MPAVTLVVCVHLQRDLLERLIRESRGCYDELIVLHDIPDAQNVREVVEAAGGRFFERPPAFLQEPHWPFAWGQAKHDWILRLDADEFPGGEMKKWLLEFRNAPEPPAEVSGYTCIWPMWDGQCAITKKWPAGHLFLFNKQRIRFFGMCEMTPVPDGKLEPLDFILHHQPRRKSYGFYNMLIRGQSRRGSQFVAHCLLGKPTDLVCWRWQDENWPRHWEQIRQQPLWTGMKRVLRGAIGGMREQWRVEKRLLPMVAITTPLHQMRICIEFWRLKHKQTS
ncbi:MAG TPA: hypothetical protein VGI03_00945 [Verrucomicrobiae bacterium]|jgi:hypothetical protein